jgi:hypothetical protein
MGMRKKGNLVKEVAVLDKVEDRLYIVTKSYLLENLGGDIVRPGYSLKQLLDINCPTCDGHL